MTSPDAPDPRSIELAVEVPGTPEEVWDAIATGPGITAWLQPTEVDGREGGTFSYDMGSGPVFGTVTGWDPPRRYLTQAGTARSSRAGQGPVTLNNSSADGTGKAATDLQP
jgi:uncharacterized protein YndB with AHSA1/START domain